jgi:hypothetical protein
MVDFFFLHLVQAPSEGKCVYGCIKKILQAAEFTWNALLAISSASKNA